MFDLNDKVVIITGASQGIGRTMATVFAESGANVICVARSEDKIKELRFEFWKKQLVDEENSVRSAFTVLYRNQIQTNPQNSVEWVAPRASRVAHPILWPFPTFLDFVC